MRLVVAAMLVHGPYARVNRFAGVPAMSPVVAGTVENMLPVLLPDRVRALDLQWVTHEEKLLRNEQVVGSNPTSGSSREGGLKARNLGFSSAFWDSEK